LQSGDDSCGLALFETNPSIEVSRGDETPNALPAS
jgi:hypothetical protein